MIISNTAYAVAGVVFLVAGLCGFFYKRSYPAALVCLSIGMWGPVIAISGFAHSGGGQQPPFGDALALVVVAVGGLQLMLGCAIALLAWRHKKSIDLDEFDEVAA